MNSQSNSQLNSIGIKSATTLQDDSKNTYVMTHSLSSRKQLFALVFNSTGHFVGVVENDIPKTGMVRRCFKKTGNHYTVAVQRQNRTGNHNSTVYRSTVRSTIAIHQMGAR